MLFSNLKINTLNALFDVKLSDEIEIRPDKVWVAQNLSRYNLIVTVPLNSWVTHSMIEINVWIRIQNTPFKESCVIFLVEAMGTKALD